MGVRVVSIDQMRQEGIKQLDKVGITREVGRGIICLGLLRAGMMSQSR